MTEGNRIGFYGDNEVCIYLPVELEITVVIKEQFYVSNGAVKEVRYLLFPTARGYPSSRPLPTADYRTIIKQRRNMQHD